MIAQHTLTHAIQYLRDAEREYSDYIIFPPSIDRVALMRVDPHKPCAAYGLAKRTLRRCGSLTAAISDLTKQLEEA